MSQFQLSQHHRLHVIAAALLLCGGIGAFSHPCSVPPEPQTSALTLSSQPVTCTPRYASNPPSARLVTTRSSRYARPSSPHCCIVSLDAFSTLPAAPFSSLAASPFPLPILPQCAASRGVDIPDQALLAANILMYIVPDVIWRFDNWPRLLSILLSHYSPLI